MLRVLRAAFGGHCETVPARGVAKPIGILLAVLPALAGCGDDGTGPRDVTVTLTVCTLPSAGFPKTCPASSAMPLQGVEVTAVATPSASVDRIVIFAAGVVSQVDTFDAQSRTGGRGIAVDTIDLPLAVGTVTFAASASSGGVFSAVSDAVVLAVTDTVPPAVTAVVVVPGDSLEPGDSVFVDVTATDNSAVARVVVRGLGVLTGHADTLYPFGPSVSGRARFRVAAGASYGAIVAFDVSATDIADLESAPVASAAVALGDFTRPYIAWAYANGLASDPLVPGDTMRGVVDVADNHTLRWVGYRLGQPVITQDSFPVMESAGQYAFSGLVTANWVGIHSLEVFARDSSGNVAYASFGLQVRVLDAVRRPIRTAPGRAGIYDYAYDRKRNALYLLHAFTIDQLPLATMAYGPPVALPFEVRGGHMDLTPSSDSIVFANQIVRESVYVVLAVVDLTAQPAPLIDTVHLTHADPANNWATETGVVAANRVFIPFISGTGFGEVQQFDLQTRDQTRRSDAGQSGNMPTIPLLLPSGDRQRMVMVWDNWGQIYSVAGDAFAQPVTLLSGSNAYSAATADAVGSRFLLGGTLYDHTLAPEATFDYPSSPAFPNSEVVSSLSPDGTVAFFSQAVEGTDRAMVLKVRLSDATVLERILMPTLARRLMCLPDGHTLIGITRDNGILAVDLR